MRQLDLRDVYFFDKTRRIMKHAKCLRHETETRGFMKRAKSVVSAVRCVFQSQNSYETR